MDKATVIRDIGAAHRSLAELVDRLPEGSLLEPAMDDWTGKDLLEEHEANLAGLAERAGVASQPTGDT